MRSYFSNSCRSHTDETETLQTDVMRVIAILGLCLTIIFALVKSLPMAPEAEKPAIGDHAQPIGEEILPIEEEKHLPEKAAHPSEESKPRKEVFEKQQSELLTLLDKVAEAREDNRILSDAIVRRQVRLTELNKEMLAVKQSISRETIRLNTIKQRVKIAAKASTQAEPKVDAEENKKQRKPPSVKRVEEKKPERIPPPAKKVTPINGFTLRFASDAVLRSLVVQETVSFYAISDDVAWRLFMHKGNPVFRTTPLPKSIYEMEPDTVPASFRVAYRTVSENVRVTWGVVLPDTIRNRIKILMSEAGGGHLVIEKNSSVRIELMDGDIRE